MPRLKSIETCHRYWECLEEKHTHEQLCDKMKIKIEPRKGDAKQCLEAVREETTKLGRMAEAKRNLEVKCVQKSSLYNKTLNEQKSRYCQTYVNSDRLAAARNLTECNLNVAKIDNRCIALRICCEPAIRCEQSSQHSEVGRTIEGLNGEIEIKLADCRERKGGESKINRPSRKNDKSPNINENPAQQSVTQKIPFVLCEKYLECQRSLIAMRSTCSRLQAEVNAGSDTIWTEHLLEQQPIDGRDAFCRSRFSLWIDEVRRKKESAVQYMKKCVNVVDITKELLKIEQNPCDIETMMSVRVNYKIDLLKAENCKEEILKQRSNCLQLRDCCIQADVCERSALYGVLADEYLIARSELLDSLKACYFQSNNHLNKLL
ncbi:hypothetical protein WR25_20901 [Diploscapter pachys]|uniref:Uncharacterized protein n=1 Tax=Diploscapter pachys TaxID=2018661 RepID=A0A2A2L042_9BILA|nr:hypothetical protein WR25_20901 [Diploscapter pachys]